VDDDDFTIAWEILDLARILYEKRREQGEEVGRELGECFGLLGDVSLENGMSRRTLPEPRGVLLRSRMTLPLQRTFLKP